jgi:hypothetical protein
VPPEPIRVLLEVVEILERLQIDYLVGGSLASSFLGEPRATVDVNVALVVRAEQVDPLVDALEHALFVNRAGLGLSDLLDRALTDAGA